MSIKPEQSASADDTAASVAATSLVTVKIVECLLQTLMNRELLLPSEVNDIYRAADLPIAQTKLADERDRIVHRLARIDLADRMGEDQQDCGSGG